MFDASLAPAKSWDNTHTHRRGEWNTGHHSSQACNKYHPEAHNQVAHTTIDKCTEEWIISFEQTKGPPRSGDHLPLSLRLFLPLSVSLCPTSLLLGSICMNAAWEKGWDRGRDGKKERNSASAEESYFTQPVLTSVTCCFFASSLLICFLSQDKQMRTRKKE